MVGSRAAKSSNLEDGSRCHALAELPKAHHRCGVLFRIENGDADDPTHGFTGCRRVAVRSEWWLVRAGFNGKL